MEFVPPLYYNDLHFTFLLEETCSYGWSLHHTMNDLGFNIPALLNCFDVVFNIYFKLVMQQLSW